MHFLIIYISMLVKATLHKSRAVNIKELVKDINGVSSRKPLEKIIADDLLDANEVSHLIHKRILPNLPKIRAPIEDIVTPLQRKLLSLVLDHIDNLGKWISVLDAIVKVYMGKYEATIAAIDEFSGIGRRSAEVILAEIGKDLSRFPSAAHISF